MPKGTTSLVFSPKEPVTSVMVERSAPQGDDLEKLTRNTERLIPEKEKKNWKSGNYWFGKRKSTLVWPSDKQILWELLRLPLLPTVHALNRWSTDKMVAFMTQYWWGNINEAAKLSLIHI